MLGDINLLFLTPTVQQQAVNTMTINEVIKEYEDDFWIMIHNKYDKDVVKTHYYAYRKHLDQYSILDRPEPTNNFKDITKEFMRYIK